MASIPTTSSASTAPPPSRQILDNKTSPLFDVLIEREEQQGDPAITPEQRASLDARLQALVARIADPGVRGQYERELRQTLWTKNRKLVREIAGSNGRRDARVAGKRRDNTALDWRVGARATERSRLGSLPRAGALATAPMRSNELAGQSMPLPAREALLIVTLLNHPWLLEAHCEEVAELTLTSPPLARLRDALLGLLAQNIALDRGELRTQLTQVGPRQGGRRGREGDHPQKRQVCGTGSGSARCGSRLAPRRRAA